ncbi:TIGR03089 family protein [Kineococcus gynurae]|uniref:TIGR03089 family protein n=1 Tax=Kineococcus gynurae TaxID=452979 RepID=A0ABV5LRD1_9ACTN
MSTPHDVPELLRRLATDDPTAPRLTWYAADHARTGERIELSARVLRTWVAKTANLLEEEFDLGPGTTVRLDLPTHWRTVVWLLAVWSVGADVVHDGDPAEGGDEGGDEGEAVDLVVAADPDVLRRSADDGVDTVAVDLAPLAVRFSGDLPQGVLDYARVVTGYGDLHDPAQEPGHAAELQRAAEAGAGWPNGVRLLTAARPADLLTTAVAAWVRMGSVVLTPDLAAVTDETRGAELVTAVA